jgi:hypothetical protein
VTALNPHNWLSRLGPAPVDKWKCNYCHMTGAYDRLRDTACTYPYPPCLWCGKTPICDPFCSGIIEALTSPDVHVAGGPKEPVV